MNLGFVNRLTASVVTAATIFVVPLLGAPALLLRPEVVLGIVAAIWIVASQPLPALKEMISRTAADRGSAIAILGSQVAAQVTGVLQFGYVRQALLPREDARLTCGVALVAAGLALRVWSIRTLGRYFTATVGLQQGQTVVTRGPYRFVRHPSYTGALLAVLGVVLALGSPIAIAVVVLLVVPAYLFRIWVEEQALSASLGAEYRAWKVRTPAFLPRPWPLKLSHKGDVDYVRHASLLLLSVITLSWSSIASSATTNRWDASSGTLPPWPKFGSGQTTLATSFLTVSTTTESENAYFFIDSTSDQVNIEFRGRYVSGLSDPSPPRAPMVVQVQTAPYTVNYLFIREGQIFLLSDDTHIGATAAVPTSDSMHTYRITVSGIVMQIYYDGVLELTGNMFNNPATLDHPGILWGEASGAAYGTSEWEYFQYSAPTITAPRSVVEVEGDSISIAATATDPDAGDGLTMSVSGEPSSLSFSSTPGPSLITGSLDGTLRYTDSGSYTIVWSVTDSYGLTSNSTTNLSVLHSMLPPFVKWTSIDVGSDSAQGVLGPVHVTLTGGDITFGNTGGGTAFNYSLFCPPLSSSGFVEFVGTNPSYSYTISFGSPIQDPILHIASLASVLTFSGVTLTKLCGQDNFTVSGGTVTGAFVNGPNPNDANGTVRVNGLVSTLSFTAYWEGAAGFTRDGIDIQVLSPDPTGVGDTPTAPLPELSLRLLNAPVFSDRGAPVSFTLPYAGHVALRVYDVRGSIVSTLVNSDLGEGNHAVTWDGRARDGRALGAGVYFLRLDAPAGHAVKKLVILK